jgi:hypothetical protein
MIEPLIPVPGVEHVPDGETDQIEKIAHLMVQLLEKRYRDGAPCLRGVHPKAHGCARATFTVHANIPDALRVGLFADAGACYEAVVRFSNAAALVGPDCQDVPRNGVTTRQHGSRGMAVKILGLPGATLASDEPGTQDLLMVNFPVFPFANVADYLALTQAQLEFEPDMEAVFARFGAELVASGGALRARSAGQISAAIQQIATADPLSSDYFGAAPFMFGSDRVMKFSARPTPKRPDTPLPDPLDADYLRLALATRLRESEASFDFAVQVRAPSEEAAIEDVTQPWEDVPHQSVAHIAIPAQNVDDPALHTQCESLFFTPWHTLAEHRPVGGVNRLRLAVYRASVERRRQTS